MFDNLSAAGLIHSAAALVALATGGLLMVARKGTRLHRMLGIFYIVAMAHVLGAAAFMPATVVPFFGTSFGFFHLFLVIGGISMAFGIAALLRWRRRRDTRALRAHQIHLAYSYAGLIMAGLSQLLTNPRYRLTWFDDAAGFWASFIILNLAVYAVAVWLIQTRVARGDPLRFLGRRSADVAG